jgi:hypothetical protein
MAGFLVTNAVRGEMIESLWSSQMTFLPGGSEIATLVLKALLEDGSGFACDLKNAFNSFRRDKMLEALYAEPTLAPMYRLVNWAYADPTELQNFSFEEKMASSLARSCPKTVQGKGTHWLCSSSALG